jgi:hypothetical protein
MELAVEPMRTLLHAARSPVGALARYTFGSGDRINGETCWAKHRSRHACPLLAPVPWHSTCRLFHPTVAVLVTP